MSSLTTTVFSQRSMRRFEASLRKTAPKGHETFISRTAPHQGLAPTSSPPRVQDTPRHPQVWLDACCQARSPSVEVVASRLGATPLSGRSSPPSSWLALDWIAALGLLRGAGHHMERLAGP